MKSTYKNGVLISILFDIEELNWNENSVEGLEINWNYLNIIYTEFQVKVWKELVKIPWGETRTYKDIAIAIGSPNSYRAVANACGKNPLLLFIPCHRIVSSNGIGGYTPGVEIKKKLLKYEGISYK
jgi:O-6-methylguanine DNA methyltransferase